MAIKTYLAAQNKNGIVEAISLKWLRSTKGKKWDIDNWKKGLKKEDIGTVFIEVTDSQLKKGIDKYGKWYEKNRKKEEEEMYKIKEKKA